MPNILRTGLRQAIQRKRRELVGGKVILLQDNVGPHRKKEVLAAMESLGSGSAGSSTVFAGSFTLCFFLVPSRHFTLLEELTLQPFQLLPTLTMPWSAGTIVAHVRRVIEPSPCFLTRQANKLHVSRPSFTLHIVAFIGA